MNEQFLYGRPQFPAQLNMSHPLTRGLVGCWVLNDRGMRAWDSSPYKNHGLATGTTPDIQGRTFDGASYISALLNSGLNDDFTILSWFKASNTSLDMTIIANQVSSYNNYWVSLEQANVTFPNKVFAALYDGTNNPGIVGTTNLVVDKFYHTAFVRKTGEDKIKLYLNGISDAADVTDTTTSVPTYSTIAVGARPKIIPVNFFDATISEAIIYNRALTASEIKNLYLDPYAMFLK